MESPDGKLIWAKSHADVLKNQIGVFERTHPYTISSKLDADAGEYVFHVHELGPTDPDWGLMFGDIVHNLRSTLDHLVYQLAILGQGGRALTDEEARSCSFPIYDNPSRLPNPSKDGPIKLLRKGEQTRILELQPFNAWDASIWGLSNVSLPFGRMRPAFIPGWLDALSAFDNIDKHRTVHTAWQIAKWFDAPRPPTGFTESSGFAGALEDDAEVGRWARADPKTDLPSDVEMKRYFPLGIAFGDAPAMVSAQEQLDLMTWVVEIVVTIFRPCVDVGTAPLPLSSIDSTNSGGLYP